MNSVSNKIEMHPFINGYMRIVNVPHMSVAQDSGSPKYTYLTSTIMKNIAAITRHMQMRGLHEYDYRDYRM